MDWQPNQEGLSQLVGLLRDSRSHVPGVQQTIHRQLETFNAIPDYNNYLVFVLSRLKTENEFVRTIAGILLKNHIKEYFPRMAPEVQQFIKSEVLGVVGDQFPTIRRAVSSIITTIVYHVGTSGWPNLIPHLISLLDSPELHVVDGALSTIYLLCEDHVTRLDSEEGGRPLNLLIPKLITFFRSPHESHRKIALASVNQFIVEMPAALLVNIDQFLQGVFFLSNDPSCEVRRKVCQALVTLLEVRVDFLVPHMRNVIQYMIHCTQDPDPEVSLDACEFWTAIAETAPCRQSLREFLPVLVPILLKGMVYSKEDLQVFESEEEEDEMKPDKDKDIQPRFHQSKSTLGPNNNNEGDGEDEDDEEEEEEGYGRRNDEDSMDWNLRKCSAAGLDVLSSVFQDEMLPILLPQINKRITEDNAWHVREAGILALGAIADGCMQSLQPHLPDMIRYLYTLLNAPQPLLRSITCWTISRYSRWITSRQPSEFLAPVLELILQRVLDTKKKVQEAACSAFATLEEEAQADIVPYLEPILKTMVEAFNKYQTKNLLILYDAIGTLADSVGSNLNVPEYINILLPPLINKWNILSDDDRRLLPLLECLTSVAAALGPGFVPYAPPVYGRCLKLIETTLLESMNHAQNPNEVDAPDKEFMVCALDLISGMCEGLGTQVEALVSQSNLPSLIFEAMKDRAADVRQSSFALVGDLVKNISTPFLTPYLVQYIPLLSQNLTPEFVSVCNNASWAIGEIAMRLNDEMKPFVQPIIERLIQIMNRLSLHRNLLENTAITLGRLGLVAPEIVAPYLEEFVQSWCLSLRNIRDDIEKDSAFKGMVRMIMFNPKGVLTHLVYICDAIASWFYPTPELQESFTQILHMYKNGMGESWPQYYSTFPEQLRALLTERYQL
eukprot:TRINITY_DN5573_c0_g3_i1.p1 TRINITY_DN5573_c0_g3~~TRINITY_DN5573_c0_g3_i1.p1  ORF type:complete len:897 (-),score=174.50 TRINITY_DN5573_c0_g3_i1:289-2979(-)